MGSEKSDNNSSEQKKTENNSETIPTITNKLSNLSIEPKNLHDFWDTQPVVRIDEIATGNEQYDSITTADKIRQTPYGLPAGFEWDIHFDITNENTMEELYQLLSNHYVEDSECIFRFNYSKAFLIWVLMPPGWRPSWHVGIRITKSQKLFGFISAVPCTIHIGDKKFDSVDVNFLCVNKKLRGHSMAAVLIRELRRLINRQGIFQSIYTVGKIISKPVAQSCYHHRLINIKKLIECRFATLPRNMNMRVYCKLNSLDRLSTVTGFQPMTEQHCKSAHVLLNKFLGKFSLRIEFGFDDFCHWFLPRDSVVSSFVVENDAGDVVDFISVYHLSSFVLNNNLHSVIDAVYLYYYACTLNSLQDLVASVLLWANKSGIDLFNALDIMDNSTFFRQLKFGEGDGHLNYYLFNWRTSSLPPNQVGVVLQ